MKNLGRVLEEIQRRSECSVVDVASRASCSVGDVAQLFAGDPHVPVGVLMAVCDALGYELLLVQRAEDARPDVQGREGPEPGRRLTESVLQNLVPSEFRRRRDRITLALQQAAVRRLRENPDRAGRAVETLARWTATNEPITQARAQVWYRIIQAEAWDEVLEDSERGQWLRTFSPLASVLEPKERRAITLAHRPETASMDDTQDSHESGGADTFPAAPAKLEPRTTAATQCRRSGDKYVDIIGLSEQQVAQRRAWCVLQAAQLAPLVKRLPPSEVARLLVTGWDLSLAEVSWVLEALEASR